MNRPKLLAAPSFLLILAVLPAARAGAGEVPFAAPAALPGLTAWGESTVADVDGDGDLDLLSADSCCVGSPVLWFEQLDGGPPPAFLAHTLFDLGAHESPNALVAVDLDRDGDTDLALLLDDLDADSVKVAWAENDGTPADGGWIRHGVGSWSPGLGGWLSSLGGDLAAADVDRDGDPDLVVSYGGAEILETDPDGRVVWLASDGTPADGGWTTEPLVDWRTDRYFEVVVPADLDRDGDLDLLLSVYDTASGDPDSLQWAENDGTPAAGYWLRRIIVDLAPSAFVAPTPAVADFDRDGDLDVAIGDEAAGVRWYANDGSPAGGGWSGHTVVAGSFHSVAAQDVDHDGDDDLVAGGSWYENDGTPASGLWAGRAVTGLTQDFADLDGDGDGDTLRYGEEWTEDLTIHRSARLLDERGINTLVDGAFDVAAGDLDGDGDADLVSAAEANDHVYWHRNDGTPGDDTSWNLSTLSAAADGPRAVALGDLDGDGDLDVVVASYNDDGVSWLENDGTLANWTRRVISSGAGGASDLALADFDRDGDLDVACTQFLDSEISWYRNNGGAPPTFSAFFVDSNAYTGPRALAAGDLDGDGDPDLAVVSETGDAVVWYSNDGTPATGEWPRHRTDNGDAGGPKEVALADLDRDGDLDTLVASYAGDEVAWYENDGTFAGWTRRAIQASCGGARGAAAGDFDADGDPDVLVSCYDDGALWLARGNGAAPPSFSYDLVSLGAGGARTVVAVDLDRDGDLDGAAAQGTDDQVAWYENRGGQFRVAGTAIAENPLVNDAVRGVFRAVVTHRGRAGDGQIELASVAVRLEETPGVPLDPFQAASLIDEVAVYGDDGDNVFEPGIDPRLAGVSPAGIDLAGVVWVDLADGAAAAALAATAQKTFFVALDLADPFLFAAPRTLVVTLLTEGDSVCQAEDRAHDLPLALEWRSNRATATLAVLDVLFRDGFETGDTSRWTAAVP